MLILSYYTIFRHEIEFMYIKVWIMYEGKKLYNLPTLVFWILIVKIRCILNLNTKKLPMIYY